MSPVTADEAKWVLLDAQSYITLRQWADDAMYARRAYERLVERSRNDVEWDRERHEYVNKRGELKCTGWEREVLERQVLNYVLEHGSFPSKDHVKTLKANAAQAKKERASVAQIRRAQLVLAKEAA
jgi:hypothetical protein